MKKNVITITINKHQIYIYVALKISDFSPLIQYKSLKYFFYYISPENAFRFDEIFFSSNADLLEH